MVESKLGAFEEVGGWVSTRQIDSLRLRFKVHDMPRIRW